jgi:hypothetical protein
MMIGDAYLPGCLVMAQSLRATGTKYPIVIMVTPDVSEGAMALLAEKYDRVIIIPYLEYKTHKLDGNIEERYGHWNDKGYTKYNMMALTDYKKVLYLEPDEHILHNIDFLFERPTPFGLFSSPWGWPVGNRIMNPYHTLKDGDYVQPWMIEEALTNYGHGSIGTPVMIRPDLKLFEKLKSEIAANQPFGFPTVQSGIEEVVLPWFYSMVMKIPVYQTHMKYGWVPWKIIPRDRSFNKIYVNHFFGIDKPWMVDRLKYDDDYWNAWWAEYSNAYYSVGSAQRALLDTVCPHSKLVDYDSLFEQLSLDD